VQANVEQDDLGLQLLRHLYRFQHVVGGADFLFSRLDR